LIIFLFSFFFIAHKKNLSQVVLRINISFPSVKEDVFHLTFNLEDLRGKSKKKLVLIYFSFIPFNTNTDKKTLLFFMGRGGI